MGLHGLECKNVFQVSEKSGNSGLGQGKLEKVRDFLKQNGYAGTALRGVKKQAMKIVKKKNQVICKLKISSKP